MTEAVPTKIGRTRLFTCVQANSKSRNAVRKRYCIRASVPSCGGITGCGCRNAPTRNILTAPSCLNSRNRFCGNSTRRSTRKRFLWNRNVKKRACAYCRITAPTSVACSSRSFRISIQVWSPPTTYWNWKWSREPMSYSIQIRLSTLRCSISSIRGK